MSMDSLAFPALAGGAMLTSAINYKATKDANAESIKAQRELQQQNNAFAKSQAQNAISYQVNGLKQNGFSVAGMENSSGITTSASGASAPNVKAPQLDPMQLAQIQNINANTEKVKAETDSVQNTNTNWTEGQKASKDRLISAYVGKLSDPNLRDEDRDFIQRILTNSDKIGRGTIEAIQDWESANFTNSEVARNKINNAKESEILQALRDNDAFSDIAQQYSYGNKKIEAEIYELGQRSIKEFADALKTDHETQDILPRLAKKIDAEIHKLGIDSEASRHSDPLQNNWKENTQLAGIEIGSAILSVLKGWVSRPDMKFGGSAPAPKKSESRYVPDQPSYRSYGSNTTPAPFARPE